MSQPRRASFREEMAHLPQRRPPAAPKPAGTHHVSTTAARLRTLRVAYLTGWRSGLWCGLLWGLCSGIGLFWLLVILPTLRKGITP